MLYHPDYPNCAIAIDKLGVGGDLYTFNGNELELDKIKSIETFNEIVQVWNYELDMVHNYISDGILSHNMPAKLSYAQFTSGHNYKKRKTENISQGDLVKLNSNNELIKTTSVKDTSVVGILWKKREIQYIDMITTGSVAPDYMISSSYTDSKGDRLLESETGSIEIWTVASIGDSIEYNSSSSLYTLEGFKVCNQGGDVSIGDLLCSSDTAGYLMKQPTEYVITSFDGDNNPQYEERQSQCSYTVAKAMEDVTFDSSGLAVGVYGYLYCG
jgi:hypothetical protein